MEQGQTFDYKGWAHRGSDGAAVEVEGTFVVDSIQDDGQDDPVVHFTDSRYVGQMPADQPSPHSFFYTASHLAGAGDERLHEQAAVDVVGPSSDQPADAGE